MKIAICEKCGNEYYRPRYYKTKLCSSCYEHKRKDDNRRWIKKQRYLKRPIEKKVNDKIRPYVVDFLQCGYKIIDAGVDYILIKNIILFSSLPNNWFISYDNEKEETKLYHDGNETNLVDLGVWFYYNIKNKNVRKT